LRGEEERILHHTEGEVWGRKGKEKVEDFYPSSLELDFSIIYTGTDSDE
jgi:hypothetical protein